MEFTWFTLDPKYSKPKRKQNIICIYEESEQAFWTHNKIVTFFLNRLIIDEDAANECIAICSMISKGLWGKVPFGWGGDNHEKIEYGHEKTQTDKIILSEIIDKASKFEHEEYNTHFLLGTAFYNSPHPYYFMDGMIQSTKNWLTVYVRVCSFLSIRAY